MILTTTLSMGIQFLQPRNTTQPEEPLKRRLLIWIQQNFGTEHIKALSITMSAGVSNPMYLPIDKFAFPFFKDHSIPLILCSSMKAYHCISFQIIEKANSLAPYIAPQCRVNRFISFQIERLFLYRFYQSFW